MREKKRVHLQTAMKNTCNITSVYYTLRDTLPANSAVEAVMIG